MKRYSVNNPRFPHHIKIYREVVDDVFNEGTEEILLYEGDARNFFNTTTDGDNKVVTNMRKSAIPLPNEYVEKAFLAGDKVVAFKGKDNTAVREYGEVTDFKPANFGTEIFWMYVRN